MDPGKLSDELCQAFVEALTQEPPVTFVSDRNFATPNDAYAAFLEIARRTIPREKLQILLEAREKDTLEEALSVDFVFSSAMAELSDRIKRGE